MDIRKTILEDLPALERIYPLAFPEEDLLPVVRQLVREEAPVLSLCAAHGADVVGHVAFTLCHLDNEARAIALLAPLCVVPDHHGQGIGSALVKDGFERLRAQGSAKVMVLGDPAYYSRFGFEQDDQIVAPYPLPEEWRAGWQSVDISGEGDALSGALIVPPVWRDPALWLP